MGDREVTPTTPRKIDLDICRDEWSRWQQGQCGTYAHALMIEQPGLRFGGVDFFPEPGYDNPAHFVAHDDTYAYDSAGRHRLPYRGINRKGKWLPDIGDPGHWGIPEDEAEWGIPDEDRYAGAFAHIRRHHILDGVYGTDETRT